MECMSPISITIQEKINSYKKQSVKQTIECKKCIACMVNRQDEWIIRLNAELRASFNALFVTLTYNDINIPKTVNKDTGEIIHTLRYSDVQKFFKRLRKQKTVNNCKHYTVGEYGETTLRPHYHSIIYNAQHEEIQKAWPFGYIKTGTVTTASIRYVTKYMGKRIKNTPDFSELPKNIMSQGLGKSYLTDEVIRFHRESLIDHITLPGGRPAKIPRYYKDKIFNSWELKYQLAKKNELKFKKQYEHYWSSYGGQKLLSELLLDKAERKMSSAKWYEVIKQRNSLSNIY